MFNTKEGANPQNGKLLLDYLFKEKISVLRSKILITAKAKAGLLDGKHMTTNLIKSFNNMIQLVMLTNRKCFWFYLLQKIIEFFDNTHIKMALKY